jgi:hypothetical protein
MQNDDILNVAAPHVMAGLDPAIQRATSASASLPALDHPVEPGDDGLRSHDFNVLER